MLQKKLFTLACAIAIAGIGACFLPPARVPPPPLPPHLASVHIFAIQVQDTSGKDLIDEDAMSDAVALAFNQLWKDYSVRAKAFQASSNSPTLKITLLNKSASSSGQRWTFQLNSSSTFTAADGRVLWQEQDENSQFSLRLENGLPPDGWNARNVMKQAAYTLAKSVGGNVLKTVPPK